MKRVKIHPDALAIYMALTTQLIQRGELRSMRQVVGRFSRKQLAEILGMNIDRLIQLEKDWSRLTVAEKTVFAHGLGITIEELEGLL
jgi:hypothetical protein